MGIEQPQLAAIGEIFTKGKRATQPLPALYSMGRKTPNQDAMAATLGLSVSRLWPKLLSPYQAQQQARDFFALQAAHGHQSVGDEKDAPAGGGKSINEQGAPDPHSELWGAFAAGTLREASLQKLGDITALALSWWNGHLSLVGAFWTPAGARMPCGRALSLPPQWIFESRVYALIVRGEDGNQAKAKYGAIPPPAKSVYQLIQSLSGFFPQMRPAVEKVKLGAPVRKWTRTDGGFVAALVENRRSIDKPCGWMSVDGAGKILSSDRSLSTFMVPPGTPEIVGA